MTEAEFNALAAQGYNRIPVTLETFSDLDTPLSVYLKLANAPNSYLLESVQGGERFGRYSIIGLAAPTRIEARGNTVLLLTNDRLVERLVGDGLVPLRSALGLHDDPARTLAFAPDHQRVLHGLGHLALLSDARVARQLVQWLATPGI